MAILAKLLAWHFTCQPTLVFSRQTNYIFRKYFGRKKYFMQMLFALLRTIMLFWCA